MQEKGDACDVIGSAMRPSGVRLTVSDISLVGDEAYTLAQSARPASSAAI